jgi:hypothetical protein
LRVNPLPKAKPTPVIDTSPVMLHPSTLMQILSTQVEFGGMPSDAAISFINIYGLIALHFDINRAVYIGPYFKHTLAATTDYQIMPINGKTVDLASFREWGSGIALGVYLPISTKLLITPELRIGYNEYTMQDINFMTDHKLFVNHTYINFTPRINLGLKMSDYTLLGINAGYSFPKYMTGSLTDAYNPNSFMYGLYVRFYLPN